MIGFVYAGLDSALDHEGDPHLAAHLLTRFPVHFESSETNFMTSYTHLTIPSSLGGESLLYYKGDIVTGELTGYLTGFSPITLEITWRVKCPGKCRILGIREYQGDIVGVNLHGTLFR